MANTNLALPPGNYNSRWFIWTIVFLVVAGISLVSYIVLSDNGTGSDVGQIVLNKAPTGHRVMVAANQK